MMTLSGSERIRRHWAGPVKRHYATTHRQSAREGLNAKSNSRPASALRGKFFS
jgi:hypothetical protein